VELFEHIVAIRRRDLGPADPLTLETQTSLLIALVGGQRYSQAKQVAQTLLNFYEADLGPMDPLTIQAEINLNTVLEWIDWEAKKG
jgi:hypothetical protein